MATRPRLRLFAGAISLAFAVAWLVIPATVGAAAKQPPPPFGLAALATDPSP